VSDITHILTAIEQGDPYAAEKLLPLVYDELRKLAASRMANESAAQTLQPTALVHEAWLRLVGKENPKFANRAHFFAAAAEAMRRILVDQARRKLSLRGGGNLRRRPDFRQRREPPERFPQPAGICQRWSGGCQQSAWRC